MRIAVLSHNLIGAGARSVGVNVVSLLPEIAPNNKYLFIVPENCGYEVHAEKVNVKTIEVPRYALLKRLWFENYGLPKLINEFSPDFIWGLGNFGLVNPPCKQGLLIHQPHLVYSDEHRGTSTFMEKLKYAKMLRKKVAKCSKTTDMFFCQTPVMKKRFAETYNFPEDKIVLFPNAVSEFTKIDESKVVKPDVFNGFDGYNLFFLSKFYGHKNPMILLDVFSKYREELGDVRCLISMERGQHPSDNYFYDEIEKRDLHKHIVPLGPLQQSELAGYFLNSDALFLHTLMESFSGTYLEAMHFGLPILTSDLDFAKYVCDDAALYFNPWDAEDIANKILQLKNNSDLAKTMVENGRKRLPYFGGNWREIIVKALNDIDRICFNKEIV